MRVNWGKSKNPVSNGWCFEGHKSMLSGGAESSIVLWDLEKAENTSKQSVHRPVATLEKFGLLFLAVLFRQANKYIQDHLHPTNLASHIFPFTHSIRKLFFPLPTTILSRYIPQKTFLRQRPLTSTLSFTRTLSHPLLIIFSLPARLSNQQSGLWTCVQGLEHIL